MLNIQEVYEQYFTVVYRYLLSLSHNTHIARGTDAGNILQSTEKSRRFQR